MPGSGTPRLASGSQGPGLAPRGRGLDFTRHEEGSLCHVLSRGGTQSEAFLMDHPGRSLEEKAECKQAAGRYCRDPGLEGAAVGLGASERQ